MEDLFTTTKRLENLKTLAEKRKKKTSAPKKATRHYEDSSMSPSLTEVTGRFDFGSRDAQSFYDIDSEMASRTSESVIESAFERSFLDDDGIGLD
ncbi:MAG: hypothetical protein ABIR96_00225 [Bdellovibrionota bacterium]